MRLRECLVSQPLFFCSVSKNPWNHKKDNFNVVECRMLLLFYYKSRHMYPDYKPISLVFWVICSWLLLNIQDEFQVGQGGISQISQISKVIWSDAMAIECVLYGPLREKICLWRFSNNTGADQPAHPRSLISASVIRKLESIISKHATGKISIF